MVSWEMTKISMRVPPLAGLLAFEAALRHGSMTVAADELGLTQSAVSHRIRALEDFFGIRLLERLNPGLRATEAGALLSPRTVADSGCTRWATTPDRWSIWSARLPARSRHSAARLVAVATPACSLRNVSRLACRGRDVGFAYRGCSI